MEAAITASPAARHLHDAAALGSPARPLVEATGLKKRWNRVDLTVLDGVDLAIGEG
jgi:hypothetical protein